MPEVPADQASEDDTYRRWAKDVRAAAGEVTERLAAAADELRAARRGIDELNKLTDFEGVWGLDNDIPHHLEAAARAVRAADALHEQASTYMENQDG